MVPLPYMSLNLPISDYPTLQSTTSSLIISIHSPLKSSMSTFNISLVSCQSWVSFTLSLWSHALHDVHLLYASFPSCFRGFTSHQDLIIYIWVLRWPRLKVNSFESFCLFLSSLSIHHLPLCHFIPAK